MKKTFKRKLIIAFAALNMSIMVVGCSSKGNIIDLGELKRDLKNNSYYEFNYSNQKDMLGGSKKIISIGNEKITVYTYDSPSSMEKDAAIISKDGNIVGNSMVEWTSKPHFYKNENSIVQYIGDDRQVFEALNKALRSQFAGQ